LDKDASTEFRRARDFLLEHRTDCELACRGFSWPERGEFNWALDYFDPMAAGNLQTALWVADENGRDLKFSFAEISGLSNQVANFLRSLDAHRGERVLIMLGNEAPLWLCLLAAFKIGLL
jgi:acetyl-CoA synthetase